MIISSQQLSSLDHLQEKTMRSIALISPFSFLFLLLILCQYSFFNLHAAEAFNVSDVGPLVKKDERRSLVATEYGEVTATDISDGIRGLYHLQFITLEPNSLFLPVLLHADMVFYVHTGSGRLSWAEDDDNQMKRVNLRRGDIYMLQAGSIFYVKSRLEPERKKLRIHAIFSNTPDDSYDPLIGAYSSIRNLVRGFDQRVLRAAFKVPEDVIEDITQGTPAPGIVHAVQTKEENFWELEARFLKVFLGGKGGLTFNKKKKTRAYNILDADPDFENCNGWSLTVTRRNANLLKGSNIGLFMVNLTKGSMMGPHWNPMATEIAIVLQGQGMVRVICSSSAKKPECKNMRLMVKEGDVFAVPRFHPMAQMSFNNDSFVFMGFSTTRSRNHPQFLAGKSSVLQTLDKQVLAVSFNVTNSTIDQLLSGQADSFILECTSCAEEEKMILEEEIEREREEEEARKREEEEREREEREREEEEARQREEEARKRAEEEEKEREEREREEEEARKREEEEARKRQEEEEARRREEEEERREEEEAEREQEEERRRREKEKEQRQEEEARREREERESESRERERVEEEERQKEEEKRRQEEAEWEEEEARREEERRRRRQEEEEARRDREREKERRRWEEARREREIQEPAGRQPEEREEQRRQNEKATRKEQEEEDSREGGRRAPRMRWI
ncbi:vicilin-like seed storage protein At2g18540 isoform X2 [Juglans microcarpa x Juglans regia]|uniref:vicilin-like seed storage protein At2g18540 isoform X2 n=1 Tax=Juglans microcarpa x Juglans regia TaxID=2249226 RepID=UPI001B7DDE2C|nr:vicilin-like seed storage protein At2g18540 isoform X2 [Juglans microcarpa x Juglans regia]